MTPAKKSSKQIAWQLPRWTLARRTLRGGRLGGYGFPSLSLPDPTSACRNGQDRPSNPSMAGAVGLDWHADRELARLSDALRPGTETLDGNDCDCAPNPQGHCTSDGSDWRCGWHRPHSPTGVAWAAVPTGAAVPPPPLGPGPRNPSILVGRPGRYRYLPNYSATDASLRTRNHGLF